MVVNLQLLGLPGVQLVGSLQGLRPCQSLFCRGAKVGQVVLKVVVLLLGYGQCQA